MAINLYPNCLYFAELIYEIFLFENIQAIGIDKIVQSYFIALYFCPSTFNFNSSDNFVC